MEWFNDPFIISLLSSGIGISGALIYYWWLSRKPKAIILRPFKGIYQKVKEIKLDWNSEKFTWGENSYIVDWNKTSYLNKGKPVLFYIEGQLDPVKILEVKIPDGLSQKAKLVLKDHAIRQIIEASKPLVLNWSMTLLIMALSIGVGFAIGYVLYPHINPPTPINLGNVTQTTPSPPHIP